MHARAAAMRRCHVLHPWLQCSFTATQGCNPPPSATSPFQVRFALRKMPCGQAGSCARTSCFPPAGPSRAVCVGHGPFIVAPTHQEVPSLLSQLVKTVLSPRALQAAPPAGGRLCPCIATNSPALIFCYVVTCVDSLLLERQVGCAYSSQPSELVHVSRPCH